MNKDNVLKFLTTLAYLIEKFLEDASSTTQLNRIILDDAIIQMRRVVIDNISVEHSLESLSNLMMSEFNIDINKNNWEFDMLNYYAMKFNITR